MKLYVLPIEERCDGKCFFCITKQRVVAEEDLMPIAFLKRTLAEVSGIDKIEITGGGEASLHPQIDDFIENCSRKVPTNMYTHGKHLSQVKNINNLSELCISIAHYDKERNERIMGVYPDLSVLKDITAPIKFSLMVNTKGISQGEDVKRYLDFAKLNGASKVVVRQLFEETKGLEKFFVSTEKLFAQFQSYPHSFTKQQNPVVDYRGLKVEFEYRSCACEMDNLVLHADGKLIKGWNYK